ncbi:SEL1-like repeat protein [Amylibacter sp.]|nr:SEL1-like repeat protein [Amylibacter sp.]
MKLKIFTIILFVFFHTEVTAQDFEKGLKAAQAGDFITALKEWKPLAVQGHVKAQGNIGIMYQNGDGVIKDAVKAVKWFRLAAEQGDANAQYNLGTKYDQGDGVIQDYTEAVKWWLLSAEQGNVAAQYNLGVMYSNGNGVLQNNITSHMWYNIALVNGMEDADEWINKLEAQMSSEDLSKAKNMARVCLKIDYKNCMY